MADKTTTNFPKMGPYPSQAEFYSLRGTPSPNTTQVKKGHSKGGMLEAATARPRRGIQERLGAKLAPQATLYTPNAAEAAATQRNVVTVPSRVGSRDFYDRRMYGQTGAAG